MSNSEPPSLIEFPCEFPIKTMGLAEDDFDALVLEIVGTFVDNVSVDAVTKRSSSGGKYMSVTVTVQVETQAHLDDIYRALSSHVRIIMVL